LFRIFEENYEKLRYFAFRSIFETKSSSGKADALLLKPQVPVLVGELIANKFYLAVRDSIKI
jgi:hypothetical protein